MDFRWKGVITRHMGFRAHGRPKRCENTTHTTNPGAGVPWGAAGGGAVVFLCVVFSHRSHRIGFQQCARNPLWR
eukprot:12419763-Heterocapsa_arctica.AAC.1